MTPAAGSEMEEIVNLTKELSTAATMETAEAVGEAFLQSHLDNTWIVGYLSVTSKYTALGNDVKNFDADHISCDELRFYGNAKPYTWFMEQ